MTGPFRLDRRLLRVSGPDARSLLDNLLTQSLETVGDGDVRYGALLTPQGKILADMLLWFEGETIALELDPARADEIEQRLGMYKLRANASIARDATRHVIWSKTSFDGARADPRFPDGALGWRKLSSEEAPVGAAVFDTHRLALGVPDLARDAKPDEVFALEGLLEELNGVDFQKGCFIGQENVSRMKRRATTRKKFCPITFDGPTPDYGAAIEAGAATLGEVRAGMDGRAMALVRLDRAQAAKEPLKVGGRPVQLAPPSWLALPAPDA